MKLNFFLTLIMFIATGIISKGQSIIGLTGGYNNSIYFDKSETPHYYGEYNSHPTYCIAAFLKPRNHKNINVGSELSFVNKVLDLKAGYGGLGYQIVRHDHFNLNYLYISIFPELSIGKSFTFNFIIGPAFGFLVNSHENGYSFSYDILGNHDNWTDNGSANSDFNKFELRLFANIGFEIPIKNKFKMAINTSYSRGISNVANESLGSYAEFLSSKDLTLTLGIIYKLDKFNFSLLSKPKDRTESNDKK